MEINDAVLVMVCFFNHLSRFLLRDLLAQLFHHGVQFLAIDRSAAVSVKCIECILEFLLLLSQTVGCAESRSHQPCKFFKGQIAFLIGVDLFQL